MEDSKLIRSIKLGRRGALDRAIAKYSGYAAAVARGVLGPQASREDLEEIVADVFVALWRSAARLDETRPLKSYLAAIARNAAVDRLRRRRPEAEVLRREQAETLRRLLLEMPADDREIFVRFYYYRQTVREIAQIIGMNESTVKARLSRGRAKLREKLTKEGMDDADRGTV